VSRHVTAADFRRGRNEQARNHPCRVPYQTNWGLTWSGTNAKAKTWCWAMTSAYRKRLMAAMSSPMKDS